MKSKIKTYLIENELEDIKEMKISKENIFLLQLNYYFDDVEIECAKTYASEECKEGENSIDFYDDYILPYLSDIAIDNVEDIICDISEELDLEYQLISFDMDEESLKESGSNTFIVAFYERDMEFQLEDYITEVI